MPTPEQQERRHECLDPALTLPDRQRFDMAVRLGGDLRLRAPLMKREREQPAAVEEARRVVAVADERARVEHAR